MAAGVERVTFHSECSYWWMVHVPLGDSTPIFRGRDVHNWLSFQKLRVLPITYQVCSSYPQICYFSSIFMPTLSQLTPSEL